MEDITRKKLHYDSKLLFGPEATTQRELLQELDRYVVATCLSGSPTDYARRYPVVERAVSDLPSLSDPSLSTALRESLTRVLHERRSGNMADGKSWIYLRYCRATRLIAGASLGAEPSRDVDMALPTAEHPTSISLQTQTQSTAGSGPSSPHKEEEPKARAVRFDAQDHESDSDSAMLESPVSERGHIELPPQEALLIAEPAVPTTEVTVPVVAPVAEIAATSVETVVTTLATEALEKNLEPIPETPDAAPEAS